MQIETRRMLLRPLVASDREDLISLERDPEVMRFINGGQPTPFDSGSEDLGYLRPRGIEPDVWAALEKKMGHFVGWFSLRVVGSGEAELGYRLHAIAWGRGLGTEGARALVAHGFAQLRLRRVVAHTMAVNRASRRVMEKAGLKYERTLHAQWSDPLPGSEKGDVQYGISADEWSRSHRG